jgi:hypothetical protein
VTLFVRWSRSTRTGCSSLRGDSSGSNLFSRVVEAMGPDHAKIVALTRVPEIDAQRCNRLGELPLPTWGEGWGEGVTNVDRLSRERNPPLEEAKT